jgi:hypothetical protein
VRNSSARSVSSEARSATIGKVARAIGQAGQRLAAAVQDLFLPGQQLAAEVFELAFVHERLVLGRAVVVRKENFGFHQHIPITLSGDGI